MNFNKLNDSNEITLYTSPYCQFCREAVQFFRKEQLAFKEVDITGSKEGQEEMMALGGIATPFIIVSGRSFHSFDRGQIEEALKQS
ncbi:glutaredoxin family protein [Paenibacillus gorillae]|uniref:glutaredoxin family protein n=1 Tax=Paenibacillus gorillae TaxID=1243662 RepID=UPI0004B44691|nr:glutaredoxin family protein [Paenibacillus gorillae]